MEFTVLLHICSNVELHPILTIGTFVVLNYHINVYSTVLLVSGYNYLTFS